LISSSPSAVTRPHRISAPFSSVSFRFLPPHAQPATHIASNKAPEISAAELEEVHHRVLGHPAHAYKQALPSLDVFASHGAGAVFVALLDGVETTTSYVQGLQAARGLYQARVGG